MGVAAAHRRCHHRGRLDHRSTPATASCCADGRDRRGRGACSRRSRTTTTTTARRRSKLRDWLIARAIRIRRAAASARSRSPTAPAPTTTTTGPHARGVRRRPPSTARTAEQTAVAIIAAARGYHRREDKPFWWAHFDRLNNPVDEWADSSDVFIADEAAVVVRTGTTAATRAGNTQRWVRLTGALAAGELHAATCSRSTSRPRRRARPTTPTDAASAAPRSSRSTTRRAHRGHRSANASPRTAAPFTPVAVRADARAGRSRPKSCASPIENRGRRHRRRAARAAATPRSSTSCCGAPRERAAAPRLPRTGDAADPTSPRRCWTWTRHTSRCTAHPARARRSRRPGHRPPGQRTPLADRRRRAVTCGRREPVLRCRQGRRRPAAGRQEGLHAADVPWQEIDQDALRRVHRRTRRAA